MAIFWKRRAGSSDRLVVERWSEDEMEFREQAMACSCMNYRAPTRCS